MTKVEQFYCFILGILLVKTILFKWGFKKGQIVPRLDGHRYAFPTTCNHTMITDISESVLQRTIG